MQAASQEQYIEFGIDDENYAIPISEIQEIIKVQEMTAIPRSKPYVRGVINLRGRIVPIISLRRLFSLHEDALTKSTRFVVMSYQEESVGIIVDRINQVTRFANILPPPERLGGTRGACFAGIGVTAAGLVGILKLDEVLRGE